MKLFLFGVEVFPDNEIEILSTGEDELGFDITIRYDKGTFDGKEDTMHNCTEFHHLYNKKSYGEKFPNEVSSAFESDIHHTGSTRRVNQIEWIKVEKATVLHENY